MDELERKLLHALGRNDRISISDLARHLGVARSTAQSRLRRLETDGTITRYRVEYGDRYTRSLITSHVLIQVDQRQTAQVIAAMDKMRHVRALYAVNGEYDLVAEIIAESTAELSRVLDDIANFTGVERTNSLVILETKFER